MKKKYLIVLPILLLLLFALPNSIIFGQTGNPPDINEDKVVLGQTFTLSQNQNLNGELAIIGGTVILEEGSNVNGDIAIIGGVIEIAGTVNGDLQALGGTINLQKTARISGSVYNFSTNLTQAEGAIIEGQQIASLPFNFNFDNLELPNSTEIPTSSPSKGLGFVGKLIWAILQIMAMGALAMIMILIAPKSTDRVSRSITRQPFVLWGIGLLTSFAFPAIILVLMITIILIPLGIIGVIIYSLAVLFGWIALGYTIGKKLLASSTNTYSPALIAGLGTILITTIARLGAIIPCIGWLFGAVLSLFGLGAVILTRFGTRDYPYFEPNPIQKSNPRIPEDKLNSPAIGSILANINADIDNDIKNITNKDIDDELSEGNK